jgi:Putative heavy-metal-binding
MLVVTTENVPGHRVVEVKGQCFGVVVRSRGLGGNIMAGLRSIVGGEIHEYTQLLEDARRSAIGPIGAKRGDDGRQRRHHDAVRLGRDRPDHERDRGLRHRRGDRAGRALSSGMLRTGLLWIGGAALFAAAVAGSPAPRCP